MSAGQVTISADEYEKLKAVSAAAETVWVAFLMQDLITEPIAALEAALVAEKPDRIES